jgi:hypothetical protein
MTGIYFAHPIDHDTEQGFNSLYDSTIDQLIFAGAVVYRPSLAWSHDKTPRPALQKGNLAVLQVSDGMLALWPGALMSIGLPIEVLIALQAGKRVALMTDIEGSWVLSWLEDVSQNHLQMFTLDQGSEAVEWVMK